jgi:hypothetical protein
MTTHEEVNLRVNPEIKKFTNVRTKSDYLKTVSRGRGPSASGAGSPHQAGIIRRRSWSRSEKLNLGILITGILALAAAILALLITAHMHML